MKTIKIFISLIMVSVLMTSCLDSTTLSDDFGSSPSLVGFVNKAESYSVKADGNVYTKMISASVIGPNFTDVASDVTFNFTIDPASTAIADTHYSLTGNSVTLSKSNNLVGSLPIDILTAGMNPPMDPVTLVLNISSVEGNGVLLNDKNKQLTITINYLCSSDLAGAYHMNFSSGVTDITVTQIGDGLYHSDYLPPFSSTYWFEFSDVCGDLMITDWQYQGGNPISPLNQVVGYVDESGNLVFEGINVGGVSWYVDRDFTILKN